MELLYKIQDVTQHFPVTTGYCIPKQKCILAIWPQQYLIVNPLPKTLLSLPPRGFNWTTEGSNSILYNMKGFWLTKIALTVGRLSAHLFPYLHPNPYWLSLYKFNNLGKAAHTPFLTSKVSVSLVSWDSSSWRLMRFSYISGQKVASQCLVSVSPYTTWRLTNGQREDVSFEIAFDKTKLTCNRKSIPAEFFSP